MLVSILIVFAIFSFTGITALNMALSTNPVPVETTQSIKLQYEMETKINKALWQINSGADSYVNYSAEGTTVTWDPTRSILSVDIENSNLESEVVMDLSDDTPFHRALASNNPIRVYGNKANFEEKHEMRQFDELPVVDYAYFLLNRTIIHNGNQSSWSMDSLEIEGIHIFTGNNLEISGLNLENSTLVFEGRNIHFSNNNDIKAPIPSDSMDAVPAIVFMNPFTNFTLPEGSLVEGAIFCAGQINIENATLTGPVVANTIILSDNVDFVDEGHQEYYRWHKGFGKKSDYDWPKHISRSRTIKWNNVVS